MTTNTEPAELTTATQLADLAAAGTFIERRISRGQIANGEREASDEIMTQITELLKPDKAEKPKAAAKK